MRSEGYSSWVCLYVCLCVCLLSHISPTKRLFVLKTLSRTQRAAKVKICGVFSENAPLLRSSGVAVVFHTFRWPFFHSKSGAHAYWYSQLCLQNRSGIPSLPNDCQQHSALPKTMPLALAGTRTDTTTRYSYNARRGQFPRTRIGI